MKAFAYTTAQSPASAVELCANDARYIAGGIDLLGELKEYIATPSRLVNIKKLPGTREISKREDGAFRIGANVNLASLAADSDVARALPALAEAASEVGSPQIRAAGTVGGNLAQHSRCWYYRQRDLVCLRRGGSTCYGREGENKYLSIASGNPCVSPIVSNLATALTVLGGEAIVFRDGKQVRMTMQELYQAAWDNPLAHNSLRPGDLILAVEVPAQGEGARSTYMQVSEKSEFDWALVSCAASVQLKDGIVQVARLALGSIAPVPYVSSKANDSLIGAKLDVSAMEKAAGILLSEVKPLKHNGYKVAISKALVRRTLLKLAA